MIGRLASDPFVETVRHGKAKALFAEAEFPNGDIKTVQLFPGAGADTWPCKNDKVVIERSGGLLYAAAVWDGEEPALKPGEREVYSRDADRKRVACAKMDQEGNIEIDNDKETTAKGDFVRITKGETKITEKGDRTYVNEGNVTDTIKGNHAREIDGNREESIKGNYVLNVDGNYTINVKGDVSIIAAGAAVFKGSTISEN